MNKLLILPLILALASCANLQNIATTLGTPAEVQQEITALGALARMYVPAKDVATIHQFAVALSQTTGGGAVTPPPKTGHPKTDALITSGVAILDLAAIKFGATGAIPYQHAVGSGLLASF